LVDFLIDSGATAALVSPKLREMIGDECREGAAIRGLGSMGETVRQKITIDAVSVGSETLGPLDAVVTDLSAAGLPDVVGGLLGLDFLSRFECDFDFAEKTIRLHPRGAIACGALDVAGLIEVPLATHPTGLKTVRIRLNGCEPFPAVVDMGSFLSVVNWMAAARGGVAPDSPETRPSELTATGIDGRTMPMATAPFDLEVCGREEEEGATTKSSLTSDYRGRCCVGDLPAFAALGAETAPFASMGLDVLGRGRTVVVAGEDVVYLTPGGTPADGWEAEVGGEG
jgi:predicted aspartyl protease